MVIRLIPFPVEFEQRQRFKARPAHGNVSQITVPRLMASYLQFIIVVSWSFSHLQMPARYSITSASNAWRAKMPLPACWKLPGDAASYRHRW